MASGSFGPTTAGRMDSYVAQLQAAGGSKVMLAKGNRSKQVTDACATYGGFYLGSIGGPAARLAQDCITKVEVLEYPELGMEAVWRIEVRDFPAFIVVDDKGDDFFAALAPGTTRSPPPSPSAPEPEESHVTEIPQHDTAFDDLLDANREYADHFDLAGFDGIARRGVAMLTCMDSRIDPLGMLGLRAGDAKIVRNPGARLTPVALEAMVLGVHLLGSSGSSSCRTPGARSRRAPPRRSPTGSPSTRASPRAPSAWSSTPSTTRWPPSRPTCARCASTPSSPAAPRSAASSTTSTPACCTARPEPPRCPAFSGRRRRRTTGERRQVDDDLAAVRRGVLAVEPRDGVAHRDRVQGRPAERVTGDGARVRGDEPQPQPQAGRLGERCVRCVPAGVVLPAQVEQRHDEPPATSLGRTHTSPARGVGPCGTSPSASSRTTSRLTPPTRTAPRSRAAGSSSTSAVATAKSVHARSTPHRVGVEPAVPRVVRVGEDAAHLAEQQRLPAGQPHRGERELGGRDPRPARSRPRTA